MPIDPSIIGQLQPLRMPNVLERVLMIDELKARRQAAAALQEQREAIAEQRRQQMAAAEDAAQRGQRVRAMFQTGQPVTFDMVAGEVGVEEATKMMTAIAGLAEKGREGLARTAAAFGDVPDWMKEDTYAEMRRKAAQAGLGNLPAQWNPDVIKFLARQGLSVKEQTELAQPKPKPTRLVTTRNPDGSETSQIVEDTPGQVFTSAPEQPKVGTLEDYMRGFAAQRGLTVGRLNPQQKLQARTEWENAGRAADSEPLVPIIGSDGQPVLVPRSQAVGKRPASTREQGRPVTSGDANRIADFDTSLDELRALDTVLSAKGSTGVEASVRASLPAWANEMTSGWGTQAKQRQAVIERVKQVIGKTLEGGVLRKEDEYKYAKILPTISDTPEVVQSKIQGLRTAVVDRRGNLLDALSDAGYETGRFQARQNTPKVGEKVGRFEIVGVK